MAGGKHRVVRLRGGGLPRPLQLRRGEAVHHHLLPPAGAAPEPRRDDGGAEHLADCSRAPRSGASRRRCGQSGLRTYPYHLYVPSFGEWGFVLAGRAPSYTPPTVLPERLRFLTPQVLPQMFTFPKDMLPGAGGGQPAERPGAGALLRGRVEGDRAMTSSNARFGRAPGCAGVGLRLRRAANNAAQRSRAPGNSPRVSPLRARIPHATPNCTRSCSRGHPREEVGCSRRKASCLSEASSCFPEGAPRRRPRATRPTSGITTPRTRG